MIEIYADGGTIGRNPSKKGGAWAWCQVQNGRQIKTGCGILTPRQVGWPTVSNNLAELIAALMALRNSPATWQGPLFTDSLITIRRLQHMKAPRTDTIPPGVWHEVLRLRRVGSWRAILLTGHPTQKELDKGRCLKGRPVSKWNVWCDWACKCVSSGQLLPQGEQVPDDFFTPALREGLGVF